MTRWIGRSELRALKWLGPYRGHLIRRPRWHLRQLRLVAGRHDDVRRRRGQELIIIQAWDWIGHW